MVLTERKRRKLANENAALQIEARWYHRRFKELLQQVQGFAARHVVLSVAQQQKLRLVNKMSWDLMLVNALMCLAKSDKRLVVFKAMIIVFGEKLLTGSSPS